MKDLMIHPSDIFGPTTAWCRRASSALRNRHTRILKRANNKQHIHSFVHISDREQNKPQEKKTYIQIFLSSIISPCHDEIYKRLERTLYLFVHKLHALHDVLRVYHSFYRLSVCLPQKEGFSLAFSRVLRYNALWPTYLILTDACFCLYTYPFASCKRSARSKA